MQSGLLKTHATLISLITRTLDVLVVGLGGVLTYGLRFDWHAFPVPLDYSVLMLIGALLVGVLFPFMGVYRSWRARGVLAPALNVLGAWVVAFLVLLGLLVVSKQAEIFSRLWMAEWLALTAMSLMALRVAVYGLLRALRRRGWNRRKVVLVGCGQQAAEIYRRAHELPWAGFEIAGVFDVGGGTMALQGVERRPLDGLRDFVERETVDEVWIAVPLEYGEHLRGVLERLRYCTANVRYAPDLFGLFLLNHGVTEILDTPMIDLTSTPMDGVNRLVKAVEDRVVALFFLILISPLLLVIAIGVKLSSPGPVLFRQERLGWGGRSFDMFKFRSMPVNVEKDGVQWGNAKNKQATPFGAFLRRTSLDELPQFINVLKGDMSIVGPRPERPMFVEQFKNEFPGYMQKHMVKAGITGWAQVNGWRGDTDLQKRIEHDLYYIENWSLTFDLKIIFLTLFRGFVHKNAY